MERWETPLARNYERKEKRRNKRSLREEMSRAMVFCCLLTAVSPFLKFFF
jgi:hypothetical protein